MRRSSEAEEVPDCSGLNGGVISNPPPPMKLRAGPRGTGELSRKMGELRSLATLSVPLPRGAVGERNAARFFAASAAPSRGVWGTKLCPFVTARRVL